MNLTEYFPSVVAFAPNGVNDTVTVSPTATIRFNIDIDPEQLTQSEINKYFILTKESTDQTIPLVYVGYSYKTLSVTPSSNLESGSTYQFTVLSTIQSNQGRSAKKNYNASFTVDLPDFSAPMQYSPGNQISSVLVPSFIWSTVSVEGTGTVRYNLQIDRTNLFSTIATVGYETTTTSSSALPSDTFTHGNTYYWRVRTLYTSISGSSYSEWSPVYSFYLGTELTPSLDTRQTYPDAASLFVSTEAFDSGLSNTTEYPTLRFTMNTTMLSSSVTTDTIYFTRESVDGYPSSTKYNVPFTVSLSNRTITVTPTEAIRENTRYTITLSTNIQDSTGEYLPNEYSTYFTSNYRPLYVSATAVRANLGTFLMEYPDDLINFHIYRASLEASRHRLMIWGANYLFGGVSEAQVRDYNQTPTYPMEKWVEYTVAANLLRMRYFEMIERAGSMKRLGDYQQENDTFILGAMKDMISDLQKKASEFLAKFSRDRAIPRTVVKSERMPFQKRYDDLSFIELKRVGKF